MSVVTNKYYLQTYTKYELIYNKSLNCWDITRLIHFEMDLFFLNNDEQEIVLNRIRMKVYERVQFYRSYIIRIFLFFYILVLGPLRYEYIEFRLHHTRNGSGAVFLHDLVFHK